ncbi:MAG TPA: uroporphyrinogen-III synthase [Terracidiphilus sp.]
MSLPLEGRRILVTRARHQAGKLSEGLRALGAEPVEVPVLEIQPPVSYDPLDTALRNITSYDWLILTSANTVRVLHERAGILGTSLHGPKFAVIGPATGAEAEKLGCTIRLTAKGYIAEELAAALAPHILGKRILLARAAIARDIIPDMLGQHGATIDVVDAYRNGVPADAADLLRQATAQLLDAACFTSSSTATHLSQAAAEAGIAFPLPEVKAVSIGPITTQTLRELDWPPAAEADPHDVAGLIAAVARLLNR